MTKKKNATPKTEFVIYKIQNKQNYDQYSTGGGSPKWHPIGKIFTRRSHITQHMKCIQIELQKHLGQILWCKNNPSPLFADRAKFAQEQAKILTDYLFNANVVEFVLQPQIIIDYYWPVENMYLSVGLPLPAKPSPNPIKNPIRRSSELTPRVTQPGDIVGRRTIVDSVCVNDDIHFEMKPEYDFSNAKLGNPRKKSKDTID